MPASAAHAFFAKDVYDILPIDIKNTLNVSRIKTFAQSTDSLMFYNLLSIAPGKKIRLFQKHFHKYQTQEFFINLLRYIKDSANNDKDTLSFLVGFITHYALDSTVHPYIFYKTGLFDKNKPNTYKYNNIHTFMETFLDNDMIKRRTKANPYEFDFANFCFNIEPFSDSLNKTIGYTFFNTFKLKDMDKIYYKSLKQMKFFIKYFRQDKYGIKRNIYKFCDSFTSQKTFRLEALSYHYPLNDRHNFLNQNHRLWRNPTTYDMTSTESFVDLYLKAIKIAKILICASFDYLNNKEIEIEKVFINTSYVTALNCDSKKELKYFEF